MTSPLTAWLNGDQPLPKVFRGEPIATSPDEWSMFLSIDEKVFLHTAGSLKWKSLDESYRETLQYVEAAKEHVFGGTLESLDNEDRFNIQNTLGPPPAQVTPIYFITVDDGTDELIVYVGKTTASSRFQNGHPAATKLHDPVFRKADKFLYRCSVWFYTEDQYFSCEWIPDLSFSESVIDTVESHLIYAAKPILNTQKVEAPTAKWNIELIPDTTIEHRIKNLPFG